MASSFSVVTVILSLLFGEMANGITLTGIGLTACGVACATVTRTTSGSRTGLARGALWAIAASLLLGVAFYGLRMPAEEIGGLATVWIGRMQAVLLLPLFLWMTKHKPTWPEGRRGWMPVLTVGVLDAIALASYNTGLLFEQTAIVITATSLFAVVTLLWGVVLGKERLRRNQ